MCSRGRLCGADRNRPIFSDVVEVKFSTANCCPPWSCVEKCGSNRTYSVASWRTGELAGRFTDTHFPDVPNISP